MPRRGSGHPARCCRVSPRLRSLRWGRHRAGREGAGGRSVSCPSEPDSANIDTALPGKGGGVTGCRAAAGRAPSGHPGDADAKRGPPQPARLPGRCHRALSLPASVAHVPMPCPPAASITRVPHPCPSQPASPPTHVPSPHQVPGQATREWRGDGAAGRGCAIPSATPPHPAAPCAGCLCSARGGPSPRAGLCCGGRESPGPPSATSTAQRRVLQAPLETLTSGSQVGPGW